MIKKIIILHLVPFYLLIMKVEGKCEEQCEIQSDYGNVI